MATEIVTRYPLDTPEWMKGFPSVEDDMQRRLRLIEDRLSRIEASMQRGHSNPAE